MLYFAAACMTWDLAESGVHFITTVINGADLVPTFSAASVDDLRSEVFFCILLIYSLQWNIILQLVLSAYQLSTGLL